ncbi:MAG: hypothetical protein N2517_09425, partial [Ignavibacteria bacterium]|nr:hypothetical protein [Ignavibacteria bacterium]
MKILMLNKHQQLSQHHFVNPNIVPVQQYPEMHLEKISFPVIRKGAINRWPAIRIKTEIWNM